MKPLFAYFFGYLILHGFWGGLCVGFFSSEFSPSCGADPIPALLPAFAFLSLKIGWYDCFVTPALPRYIGGAFSIGATDAELWIADWRRHLSLPLGVILKFSVDNEDQLVDVRPWAGGVMAPVQPRLVIHMNQDFGTRSLFFPLGYMPVAPETIAAQLNAVLAASRPQNTNPSQQG